MLWTLLWHVALAAPPDRHPGVGLGVSALHERGLAGVLRIDLGPLAVEGSGGLSTIPLLSFDPRCLGAALLARPQFTADLLIPAAQSGEDLRVGFKGGAGWIEGIGAEGRAGVFGDLSLTDHVFVQFSGGFRVMPGLAGYSAGLLDARCGSAVLRFEPSPLSAFQQFLGIGLFLRT
jgi:hypothetical protein